MEKRARSPRGLLVQTNRSSAAFFCDNSKCCSRARFVFAGQSTANNQRRLSPGAHCFPHQRVSPFGGAHSQRVTAKRRCARTKVEQATRLFIRRRALNQSTRVSSVAQSGHCSCAAPARFFLSLSFSLLDGAPLIQRAKRQSLAHPAKSGER